MGGWVGGWFPTAVIIWLSLARVGAGAELGKNYSVFRIIRTRRAYIMCARIFRENLLVVYY